MTSLTNIRFRRDFARLPARIQVQARRAYQTFKSNPAHPSLEFKKLPPHDTLWSVRVNAQYRAVGARTGDQIVWFFIGTHAGYDALLARL